MKTLWTVVGLVSAMSLFACGVPAETETVPEEVNQTESELNTWFATRFVFKQAAGFVFVPPNAVCNPHGAYAGYDADLAGHKLRADACEWDAATNNYRRVSASVSLTSAQELRLRQLVAAIAVVPRNTSCPSDVPSTTFAITALGFTRNYVDELSSCWDKARVPVSGAGLRAYGAYVKSLVPATPVPSSSIISAGSTKVVLTSDPGFIAPGPSCRNGQGSWTVDIAAKKLASNACVNGTAMVTSSKVLTAAEWASFFAKLQALKELPVGSLPCLADAPFNSIAVTTNNVVTTYADKGAACTVGRAVDDALLAAAIAEARTLGTPVPAPSCVKTGCSSHICAPTHMVSTCEFREEYACYSAAVCEAQAGGRCGFTRSPALIACLAGVQGIARCGGFAGLQCATGLTCVDDPTDTCNPATGGADCGGICVP